MQSSNRPNLQQDQGTPSNSEDRLLEKLPVFDEYLYQFKYGVLTTILATNGIQSEDIIVIIGNETSKFMKMLANRFRSAKLLHSHFKDEFFSDYCKQYSMGNTALSHHTIVIAKPLFIILFQNLKKEDKVFYENILTHEFPVNSNEYKGLSTMMASPIIRERSFFNICKTIANNTEKLAEKIQDAITPFVATETNATATISAVSTKSTPKLPILYETRFDVTQFIRENLKSDTSLPANISFSVVFMPRNLHDKYRSLTYKIYRMGDINKDLAKRIPSFRKFLNHNDFLYMIIIDQAFRQYEGPNQTFSNPVKPISQFPQEENMLKELLIATKHDTQSRSLELLLTSLVHCATQYSKELLMPDLVQISNSSNFTVMQPSIRSHIMFLPSNSNPRKRKVYLEAEQRSDVKKTKSYDAAQLIAASTLVLFSEKTKERGNNKPEQDPVLEVRATLK